MSTATAKQETAEPPNVTAQFRGTIRADYLRELLATAGSVAEEVRIGVGSDGDMHLKAIDGSQVAMVTWDAPADVWGQITVTQPGPLALHVKGVLTALRGVKRGETLIGLRVLGDRLEITTDIGTQEMIMSDPTGISIPRVPPLTPPITVEASLEEFRSALRQSTRTADHVYLVVLPDGPQLWVKALTERETVRFRVPVGSIECGKQEGRVAGQYPLNLLSAMVGKGLPKGAIWNGHPGAEIGFGTDYPMRIRCRIMGGLTECTLLLAPRVTEESGNEGTRDPDGPDWVPPPMPTAAPTAPAGPKARKARPAPAPAPVVAVPAAASVEPLPPAPTPPITDNLPTAPASAAVQIEPVEATPTRGELLRLVQALALWDKSMGYWDSEIWKEVRRIAGVPVDPRHTADRQSGHVVGAW